MNMSGSLSNFELRGGTAVLWIFFLLWPFEIRISRANSTKAFEQDCRQAGFKMYDVARMMYAAEL